MLSSYLAPAGPAVWNPQGAPGAEVQPEGHPEREGAAACRETGQRHCSIGHSGLTEPVLFAWGLWMSQVLGIFLLLFSYLLLCNINPQPLAEQILSVFNISVQLNINVRHLGEWQEVCLINQSVCWTRRITFVKYCLCSYCLTVLFGCWSCNECIFSYRSWWSTSVSWSGRWKQCPVPSGALSQLSLQVNGTAH